MQEDDFWEPSRAQVWRRDTVAAAVDAARREVALVGLGAALTTGRRARASGASSLRGELTRFARAAAALEVAASEGPSRRDEVKALHAEATRCLRRVGIGRRGSRLSELHEALEAIARAASPSGEAPWEGAEASGDPARALLDGGSEVSLRLLESAFADGAPTDRGAASLSGARLSRLSGRFDHALAWETACVRAMREGSPAEILRALRLGTLARTPARMLELYLWARAIPSKALVAELPAAASLRRTASGEGDPAAWTLALALEKADKASLPLTSRTQALIRAIDGVDDASDPALSLLGVAAGARWLLRHKQVKEGTRLAARYRALSLSITDGSSADVYSLALSKATARAEHERPDADVVPSALRLGYELLKARWRVHASPDEAIEAYVEILAYHLSALKGPLMKVGQVMAFYGVPMPAESRALLATLHDDAAPVPFDVVRGVLESELKRRASEVFAEIDETPLSSGSVGQVHRGVLPSGERVAIKVQYPNVAGRMERDFRALRLIVPLVQRTLPRWNIAGIVSELRERMLLECDYLREAAAQTRFRERLADDGEIVIPRVHHELTTARVLVTTYFEGQTFAEFVATATPAQRSRAAEALLRYAIRTTIVERSFNTDMHPGNLLFSESALCLVDFGNVREWSGEAAGGWREILEGTIVGDPARVLAGHKLLQFVPGGSDRTYTKMAQLLTRFLTSVVGDDAPRKLSKAALLGELAPLAPSGPFVADGLQIHPDFAYAFRMYWGLIAILADLDADVRFRKISLEVLARAPSNGA